MPKNGKKKNIKTFNQKLHDWFRNDQIENHEDEIIAAIKDKNVSWDQLDYNDVSVFFWSAKYRHENILEEALKYKSSEDFIDNIYDNNTALSISAYYGYHEVFALLLDNDALIKVESDTDDNVCANAYESLGRGYWRWPTDADDYEKTFKKLVATDPAKPKRQFFLDKYHSTNNKEYLACLRLYDRVWSGKKDGKDNSYRQRDILAIEDSAVRRFFRFPKDAKNIRNPNMRVGGGAKALEPSLFGGQSVPIDGYSARSVIIALVEKMRVTSEQDVKTTVNYGGSIYDSRRRIFLAKFTLGTTQLLYEWRPHTWQKGNCIFKINNSSPEPFGINVSGELEKLTNTDHNHGTNERTKKLGELFLKKTKELQSFSHDEFTYSPHAVNKLAIRTDDDSRKKKRVATQGETQAVIHKLNGLLILWSIVEPARRLSGHEAPNAAQNKKEAINIDHIPVATMQIRALQLLSEGYIALRDIFGRSEKYGQAPYNNLDHNANYGVSTGKELVENFDIAREKSMELAKIDLPSHTIASTSSFFSRNYTKQLLQEGYGTADESSDENYSDNDLLDPFV